MGPPWGGCGSAGQGSRGKLRQEGGVGPLPQPPSTGNPVGQVPAQSWPGEQGVWVRVDMQAGHGRPYPVDSRVGC